jgi:hypothetical protein
MNYPLNNPNKVSPPPELLQMQFLCAFDSTAQTTFMFHQPSASTRIIPNFNQNIELAIF